MPSGSHARRLTSAADVAEEAAKARRQQEVATVLAALERAHGIGKARVTSIRRVQNIRLWTKFQLRRHEVLEQAGGVPWACSQGLSSRA